MTQAFTALLSVLVSATAFAADAEKSFTCHDDNAEPGITVSVSYKIGAGAADFMSLKSYVELVDGSRVSEVEYTSNVRPQVQSDGSITFYGYNPDSSLNLNLNPATKKAAATLKERTTPVEMLKLNCQEIR